MGWFWISRVKPSKCIQKEPHGCGISTITTHGGGGTPHIGVIAAVNGDSNEISEECAIPDFEAPKA